MAPLCRGASMAGHSTIAACRRSGPSDRLNSGEELLRRHGDSFPVVGPGLPAFLHGVPVRDPIHARGASGAESLGDRRRSRNPDQLRVWPLPSHRKGYRRPVLTRCRRPRPDVQASAAGMVKRCSERLTVQPTPRRPVPYGQSRAQWRVISGFGESPCHRDCWRQRRGHHAQLREHLATG